LAAPRDAHGQLMSVWCCIASGPSLTPEDVDAVRDKARTIVINDSYRLAPWADALYAADLKWWHVHHERAKQDFDGRMYSIEDTGDRKNPRIAEQLYGVKVYGQERVKEVLHTGLSRVPGVLRLGGLSGYQAINLAYLWGAKVILLLGYDLQLTGGQRHWFGDHKDGLTNSSDYDKRIRHFKTINPTDYGIEIINCSRQTAMQCFPRMTIQEALARYACSA